MQVVFLESVMQSPSFEQVKRHRVVRAGAGAGKTTRLVGEVIETAREYKKSYGVFPRMVLTTFTRKATQEIRERLILKACEQADPDLLEYLASPAYLQVSTIHGVLALFLRRYGHLVGLDNGFTFMSEGEASRHAKKLVRDLCLQDDTCRELVTELGIGKLSELARKLSQMRLQHAELRPAVTQDLLAAWATIWQTLGKDFEPLLQKVKEECQDIKFHEYVDTISQIIADLYPPSLNPNVELERGRERLPNKPRINKKSGNISEDLNSELAVFLERFKKEANRPEMVSERWPQMLETFQRIDKASRVFQKRFERLKREMGLFEMPDLETVSLDILRNHPHLGQSFADDFDYWLIDEYQDTSPVQTELLKYLIGSAPTFVVGDPQQSIYLFRGARSEVFAAREAWVESVGGALERKDQNWRSIPELLEFFNDTFTRLSPNFMRMRPRSEVLNPDRIVAYFCPSETEEELNSITVHLHHLLESGCQPEDIAILGRTNKELAKIARALRHNGYPTHVHASSGFFSRREILDAMALLKFLVNPLDNENLLILLRAPWFKVSDEDLAQWLQKPTRHFWDDFSKKDHPVISQLCSLIERAQVMGVSASYEVALVEFGLFDFSHHHDVSGRRESNLWKLLCRLKEEETRPGFSYLQFVQKSFLEIDLEDDSDESDAIAALEPRHVQLMTIHASKGLQFRHVILPNLGKKPRSKPKPTFQADPDTQIWTASLPMGENNENQGTLLDVLLQQRSNQLEQEESLRVLYVALTRAKESVFLSWNKDKDEESWANHFNFKKDEGIHRTTNYSYSVLPSSPAPVTYAAQTRTSRDVRGQYATPAERRVEKVSVTELVADRARSTGGGAPPAAVLVEGLRKSAEGVIVHKMMETLHYNWDFNFQQMAQNWFGAQAEKALSAIEWIRALESLPIKQLIRDGQVEWGYQLLKEQQIVEGQVDLWGQVGDDIWIVDYKSGSQKYETQAFLQLETYAQAIEKLHPQRKIHLCVIYPMDRTFKTKTLPCQETK